MAFPLARPARARRFARLACAVAGAALAAGACRLDDRELSDEGLTGGRLGDPGGGECPNVGDNACETCLFAECCAELQACSPGSPCERYLTCATNCADDQLCVSDCGADLPVGLGNAVALSVCAGSRCSVCSGQTATTACVPGAGGACQTPEDCGALEAGALEDLDVTACPACELDLVSAACQRCLAGQTGLSQGCSACVADWLACAVENCLLVCRAAVDPNSCEICMSEAGCTGELQSCGFSG